MATIQRVEPAMVDEGGRLARRLLHLMAWLRTDYEDHIAEVIDDMPLSAFALLQAIDEQPGILQKDLLRQCRLQPSTLSLLLTDLVAQGWIERRPLPRDRRQRVLYITAAGRGWLEDRQRHLLLHMADLLSPLSPGEQARLVEALSHMVERAR